MNRIFRAISKGQTACGGCVDLDCGHTSDHMIALSTLFHIADLHSRLATPYQLLTFFFAGAPEQVWLVCVLN